MANEKNITIDDTEAAPAEKIPAAATEVAAEAVKDVVAAAIAEPGTRVVRLSTPFDASGLLISEIKLRPVRLGDMVDVDKDGISVIALLERLSGQPSFVIRGVRYPDAEVLLSALLMHVPASVRAAIVE